MPKIAKKKPGKGSSKSYKFDSKGRIIGPDGKKVADAAGDTPIVISGGSLAIFSEDYLEDIKGQKTKLLFSVDTAKHISSVNLIGFEPAAGNSGLHKAIKPKCAIEIHYE